VHEDLAAVAENVWLIVEKGENCIRYALPLEINVV